MKSFGYLDLGATLYVPVLHPNLSQILLREKYPFLRSIVICLEDSTAECDVARGMQLLRTLLESFVPSDLIVFVRPRNPEILGTMLQMPGIERIDGFALPKFGTYVASYLQLMRPNDYPLMPILETDSVFDTDRLRDMARELEPFKARVTVIRVGGEDILSQLGMLRNCERTLYEILPLYLVLSQIITIFRPAGFEIASPVVSCYGNPATLIRELEGDVEHQLFNKTCIHPRQVEVIQHAYRVSQEDFDTAQNILHDARAVFGADERMLEKAPHSAWARNVVRRYATFGVK